MPHKRNDNVTVRKESAMQIEHPMIPPAYVGRSMLPVGLLMTIGVVAVTGLVLTISVSVMSQTQDAVDEGPVARCDRLAGVVVQQMVAEGIAAESTKVRRQREQAFRSCLDDLD